MKIANDVLDFVIAKAALKRGHDSGASHEDG
jgi:hypothetical protein